eukprot:scpid86445/ scgid24143/ 
MSASVSPVSSASNQESPGAASSSSGSSSSGPIRFKTCHNLEMFLFVLGKTTIFEPRIGMKDWEEAADSLRKTFPELKGLTGRTVWDRTLREIKQFKANDNKSRRKKWRGGGIPAKGWSSRRASFAIGSYGVCSTAEKSEEDC